jgi:hypothetical protein
MTAIANTVAKRLTYKAYSTASITPGTEADYSSDPGATGGQVLRYTGTNMNLQKGIFKSAERRQDRQRVDLRHGGRKAPIQIDGELSCLTYQDLIAAVLRGSWAAGSSKTESDFTSLAASASSSNLTLGSSDWITLGYKIGDVVRASGSGVATANKNVNFQLLAFTNSNTKATVYPAPTDMSAVTSSVTLAVTGRKIFPPATSPTTRKFLFESYHADIDLALLHTEARLGGFKFSIPNEGMVTAQFSGLARNQKDLATGVSPFFSSPTAETTTAVLNSVGGQLLLAGSVQAILTSAELSIEIGATGQNVVFNPLMPEIFTGDLDVTGSLTALFADDTFVDGFDAETEFELALMLTTNSLGTGDFISAFMPRVKLTGADIRDAGEQGIPITVPFQALKKTTTSGYDAATIVLQDSLSA